MPHNRFFIDQPLLPQEEVHIEETELHHMRVMRCKENEKVELVNGNHQLAKGKILTIGKKAAKIRIETVNQKDPPKKYILAQANVRFSKLEWIFEKATELGITHFWIFTSDGSEKKQLSEQQKKRANTFLISALKQCGRLDLPKIQEFSSLFELPQFSGNAYLAHPEKHAARLIDEKPTDKEVLLIIGPEKGFTQKELSFFKNVYPCKTVQLSNHILRTETAAICAASIASFL